MYRLQSFWLGEIESIDSKIMNDSMPISLNYFGKDKIWFYGSVGGLGIDARVYTDTVLDGFPVPILFIAETR